MKKRILVFLAALVAVFSLTSGALAAPPTVTIMPYTGGSVSLIGYDLVLTAHSGYYLSALTINGESIEPVARITLNADTNYTVNAIFSEIVVEIPWVNPYTDVVMNNWFFEDVKYVDEGGIMQGVGGGYFLPETPLSRAMVVTMLYRFEGSPEITGASVFPDVPDDMWYSASVIWAAGSGIVQGYESGLFLPEGEISREEIAVILFNYAAYKGYDLSFETDMSIFTDVSAISEWALPAVSWAVKQGVISGKNLGVLDPLGWALRCEAAAMLHRYALSISN